MYITQKREFQPITLVLKNSAEAEALWKCIEDYLEYVGCEDADDRQVLIDLCNWFCEDAQLGRER